MCSIIAKGKIMTFGLGNGFGNPMLGGMNSMMGMNFTSGSGNVHQYYLQKYGCEDCFRKTPYQQPFPKPIMPVAREENNLSFFSRIIKKIMG